MKTIILALAFSCLVFPANGQTGYLEPYNGTAPTHLYSADGPLAGPDILGQYLVGPTDDELLLFGPPVPHFPEIGIAYGTVFAVPQIPCHDTARVQLAAWDSTLWGTSYGNVPADQIGRTDIVGVRLTCLTEPVNAPYFTQPAIVPIPEPPVWALAIVAGLVLLLVRRRRYE